MNDLTIAIIKSEVQRAKDGWRYFTGYRITKSRWQRKNGTWWMNDRGFIEPYQQFGRIPSHTPDDPDFPGKGEGGGSERKEQVWVDSPFSNKEELESYLKSNSEEAKMSFGNTKKNELSWDEYLFKWNEILPNDTISTPIGNVKIGKNQIFKNFYKNDSRALYIGMIKESLENPLFIIKSQTLHENSERPFVYLFVSSFRDKERSIHYIQTTVSKEGKEILISSHERPTKQIFKMTKSGRILFTRTPWQSEPSGSHVLNPTLKEGSSIKKDISKGNFVNRFNHYYARKPVSIREQVILAVRNSKGETNL